MWQNGRLFVQPICTTVVDKKVFAFVSCNANLWGKGLKKSKAAWSVYSIRNMLVWRNQ